MNDEVETIRKAAVDTYFNADRYPGFCLEGLGKATQPVRVVSVGNSRELTARLRD